MTVKRRAPSHLIWLRPAASAASTQATVSRTASRKTWTLLRSAFSGSQVDAVVAGVRHPNRLRRRGAGLADGGSHLR